MSVLKIYSDDLEIAQSILKRDGHVTREYMFVKCYPLFKSIFCNYCTDCNSVAEFITEIYVLILTPSKSTDRCQLDNFRGESSLATWLKTAALFYCYHKFDRKNALPIVDVSASTEKENDDYGDRLIGRFNSTNIDTSSLDRDDLDTVIGMMPNERYRQLIRLRYVDRLSNEETAAALGMTMANYYNKHKLAKKQFVEALNKEANNE